MEEAKELNVFLELREVLSSLEYTQRLEEYKETRGIVKRRIQSITERLGSLAHPLLLTNDIDIVPDNYEWSCPLCGHRQIASTYKSQCKVCKQLFKFVPVHKEEFIISVESKEKL